MDIDKIIEGIYVNEIFNAVRTGEITLKDVEARFIDLKTSFQRGSQNMQFNDRNKGKKSCWLDLSDVERKQVREGCSFPSFNNPIERWVAYSLSSKFALMRDNKVWNRYGIDCDGSKSTEMVPAAINALYRALWPNIPADSSDTMNSFWTTYKQTLQLSGAISWQSTVKKDILLELTDEGGHLPPEFFELKGCGQETIMEQLLMFAYLTHTIGNFIPCKGLFNTGRYAPTLDYFDITLEYVRDWYLSRQGTGAASDTPETSFNAGTLAACRGWLDYFGYGVPGWNTFVEANYLQAYMRMEILETSGKYELAKDGQGAYMVEPFFPGHDFSHLQLATLSDAAIALARINAVIIARGNQMAEALGDDPCAKLLVK